MPTTVHKLDGTSSQSSAPTVGALKEAYEREHGVPADTQTVWACSSGLELDNAATLADEDKVQLVIDQQTVTVRFEDNTYQVTCRHNSTLGDVCQTLEAEHGITDIDLILDANVYDAKGFVSTDMLVQHDSAAREYLNRPMRMVVIHKRPNSTTSDYYVDLGEWKLIVKLPWLRTNEGIEPSYQTMTLQLDRTRPDVAAFKTLVTRIDDKLEVETDSTLQLRVPVQRTGYWKCDVRNYDTGKSIEDPIAVVTGPHFVRGIIQCTNVLNCGGLRVLTWVARSLECRRCIE